MTDNNIFNDKDNSYNDNNNNDNNNNDNNNNYNNNDIKVYMRLYNWHIAKIYW